MEQLLERIIELMEENNRLLEQSKFRRASSPKIQESDPDAETVIIDLLTRCDEALTSREMVHRSRPYKRLANDDRKIGLASLVEKGIIAKDYSGRYFLVDSPPHNLNSQPS